MTREELVRQIQYQYQEQFEQTEKPHDLLIAILSSKLLDVLAYAEYLEKRIYYVS